GIVASTRPGLGAEALNHWHSCATTRTTVAGARSFGAYIRCVSWRRQLQLARRPRPGHVRPAAPVTPRAIMRAYGLGPAPRTGEHAVSTTVRKRKAIEQANGLPLVVRLRPALDLSEDQFFAFCQLNRDLRLERNAEGELLIMPPTGGGTSQRNSEI